MEILERVRAYQSKDDRVRITDIGAMVTRYQRQRVHAHQCLHLVPDPAVDRAPARAAAFQGLLPLRTFGCPCGCRTRRAGVPTAAAGQSR